MQIENKINLSPIQWRHTHTMNTSSTINPTMQWAKQYKQQFIGTIDACLVNLMSSTHSDTVPETIERGEVGTSFNRSKKGGILLENYYPKSDMEKV